VGSPAVSGARHVPATRVELFWRSTIGKKLVMGVTGLIMVAFVVFHMLGNLQVFVSAEQMNRYSAFLHGLPELLWPIRAILLTALILHIVAAVQLTRIDRAARPRGERYAQWEPQASTFASRTIRWGGVLLALFILFHVLHFTTGTIHPAGFIEHDVYRNVVASFRIWWVDLIYIVAMIALGLHLYHGSWSALRTLGINQPTGNPRHRPAVLALAILVWLGFTLIPVAAFAGWIQ
jgi:succinate dehydrogenase / fumarate reductase cytochrome b subunit